MAMVIMFLCFGLALALGWVSALDSPPAFCVVPLSAIPCEVGREMDTVEEQFQELAHHPLHLVLGDRARRVDLHIEFLPCTPEPLP